MRYRLAVLGLGALLGVLPALPHTPAAPAPEKAKAPAVYALLYVGVGRNHDNPTASTRLTNALLLLSDPSALGDDMMEPAANIRDRVRTLGREGRDRWLKKYAHDERLGGTAVVKVWFTGGTPREQAAVVNATVRYFIQTENDRVKSSPAKSSG